MHVLQKAFRYRIYTYLYVLNELLIVGYQLQNFIRQRDHDSCRSQSHFCKYIYFTYVSYLLRLPIAVDYIVTFHRRVTVNVSGHCTSVEWCYFFVIGNITVFEKWTAFRKIFQMNFEDAIPTISIQVSPCSP